MQAIFRRGERKAARRAKLLAIICLYFLGGAGLDGICAVRLQNQALWAADTLFLFA
ncbi:MAG: hypothetical protein ABSB88_11065 [Bryobacteraceae bacterium]|jgi:hypothetical protein